MIMSGLNLIAGCAVSPRAGAEKSFRVMTYNIHHGAGLDGRVDLARLAAVILSERADIVALQEVDKGVARTDRRDLPAELAALTGLRCVFSNNFNFQGGEYGNAVLTRFPVLSATNLHYTMLRPNEQRGLLQVRLDVEGHEVLFMNTHIDYRGDDAERLMNVRQIQSVVASQPGKSVILCGDFNSTPDSRTHQMMRGQWEDVWELVGQGSGFSYPATGASKRIDYVWISKASAIKPSTAWVVNSSASDHLPVCVEFRIPVAVGH